MVGVSMVGGGCIDPRGGWQEVVWDAEAVLGPPEQRHAHRRQCRAAYEGGIPDDHCGAHRTDLVPSGWHTHRR